MLMVLTMTGWSMETERDGRCQVEAFPNEEAKRTRQTFRSAWGWVVDWTCSLGGRQWELGGRVSSSASERDGRSEGEPAVGMRVSSLDGRASDLIQARFLIMKMWSSRELLVEKAPRSRGPRGRSCSPRPRWQTELSGRHFARDPMRDR